MEQDSYYYVIVDHEKGPKIACGKADLIDLLHDYDHPKIRTYTKREEAQSYLDSYEDMKTINKSKKPEKIPSPTEGPKKLKKESSDSRKNSLLKLNGDGLFGSRNEEKRTEDTSNEEYDPLNLDAIKVPPNSRNVSLAEQERERRDKKTQPPVYPPVYNPQLYEKHAPVFPPVYEKQERSFLDEKREARPTGVFEYFRENIKEQALAKFQIRPNEQYSLYFDGASKANPGNAGAGYVIYNSKREKVYTNYMNLGVKTNNQAEYSGLLYGLKSAQNLGIKYLEVYGDSQLIVYQMTGKYQVKKEELKPYNRAAKELEAGFAKINFNWVRREENSEADRLSNQGVMAKL